MSPVLQKLLGQAIVRLVAGDRGRAAELSAKAQDVWMHEHRLHASIRDILNYKMNRRKPA